MILEELQDNKEVNQNTLIEGQMKNDKRTNNDLQNIHKKLKIE